MNQELTATKPKTDLITIFKTNVARQESDFRAALPAHIPVDRFTRVLTTAVVNNPALLEADRRSLFEAAMKAAQDGLLPDGREGALVIFNAKIKDNGNSIWIKKVQWMPMIAGILKKVRNSGELLSIAAHVAYGNDDFSYELGDDERIAHRPALGDRGPARLVYAIAKTKDGGIYREIMTVEDVEKVRAVSRAANDGPWVVWWGEMAKKTVLRRLSKRLPMSSDLDDLIRRDDTPQFDGTHEENYHISRALATTPEERLKADLDMLANGENGNANGDPSHDPDIGEIISDEMAKRAQEAAAEANSDVNPVQDADPGTSRPPGRTGGANPPTGATIDLGTQRLLDDARIVARQGSAQFGKFHRRLHQKQADQLAPYLDQLRAEASAADGTKTEPPK